MIPTVNITMTHVKSELGLSADTPLSLTDSRVRALAGIPTGQIKLSDLAGKSAGLSLSAWPSSISDHVDTFGSIVTASASTTVTASITSGTTYSWSFNSTVGGSPSLTLSNGNRTATISTSSRFGTTRRGNLVCTAVNGSLSETVTIPYTLTIEVV